MGRSICIAPSLQCRRTSLKTALAFASNSIAHHDAFAARIRTAEPRGLAVLHAALDALQAAGLVHHLHLVPTRLQCIDEGRRGTSLPQLRRPVARAEVRQRDRLLHIET